MTATKTTTVVMVELHTGYGDGYGTVEVATESGRPVVNPARKVTTYTDGSPMDPWRQAVLSAPSITLVDAGVRCSPAAIKRVIGPVDCPEALRVRATRFTKNWSNGVPFRSCTDAEIVAAFSGTPDYDTLSNRLREIEAKFPGNRW